MARPKPWLKMWTEWAHDPKMLNLTLAEQAAWWRVVTLAQECNAGGGLVKGNGAPLTIEGIAKTLHMSVPKDFEVMKSMIKKMEIEDSLAWDQATLTVVHYSERQEMVPSETPEARRERVRRYRQKQTVTEIPLQSSLPSFPPDPPITLEGEGEGEGECNGEKPVTCNGIPVTSETALAQIAKRHEEYFGIITPNLSEKFKDFVKNYRGPVEWIDQAFAEAVHYKNRRWQYVEAILYSWQEKGGPHADRREPADKGGRPGAHREDAGDRDKFSGFRAIKSGPGEPEDTEED